MLIGKTITLSELEEKLIKAKREYDARYAKIAMDLQVLNKELKETNQYKSSNDLRYVSEEFREIAEKILDLRNEAEDVEEVSYDFGQRIDELSSYEERMKRAGIYISKEEEMYELFPRDIEMLNKYSEETEKAKEEALKKAEEEKEKKEAEKKAPTKKTTTRRRTTTTRKTTPKKEEEKAEEPEKKEE